MPLMLAKSFQLRFLVILPRVFTFLARGIYLALTLWQGSLMRL